MDTQSCLCCADCGCAMEDAAAENTSGEGVCSECADNYRTCDDCGEVVHVDDSCWVESAEQVVCDSCLDRDYRRCQRCEELFDRQDMVHHEGEWWCQSCFDEAFWWCEDCGGYHGEDESCPYRDDDFSSCDCRERLLPDAEDGSDPVRVGIEFETEFDTGYRREAAENAPSYLGCKEDGSLNHGVEFVTPPMSPEQAQTVIGEVFRHLGDFSGSIEDTCGLHVHVSHEELSRGSAAFRRVFAFFVLTEGFIADYFQGARRARNAYTYPIGPAIGRELFGDDFDREALRWDGDKREALARHCLKVHPFEHRIESRYHGVNRDAMRSHGTVEFRYLGGQTVTRERLKAWVRFLVEAVRFCVELDDADFLNWCVYASRSRDIVSVVLSLMPSEWSLPECLDPHECPAVYLEAA